MKLGNITPEMIGKPLFWETSYYGKIAVHVTGISPNGKVAVISIDGGPDATQCQRFPEMADGIYFAIPENLYIKPSRAKKTAGSYGMVPGMPERVLAEKAGIVPALPVNEELPAKHGFGNMTMADLKKELIETHNVDATLLKGLRKRELVALVVSRRGSLGETVRNTKKALEFVKPGIITEVQF